MDDCSAIQRLVAKIRPGAAVARCEAVAGGRNNRVFRVETSAGTFAAKQYFAGGDWDRMAAEKRFMRFCERHAVRRAPRFLAEDRAANLALHEWIPGTALKAGDPTTDNTVTAASFLVELRAASAGPDLDEVPAARDACLCLEDFFRSPRQRLADLAMALENTEATPIIKDAIEFLNARLLPRWREIERAALAKARESGDDLTAPFPEWLCFVSPSDFGFHNALRLPDGDLRFVDFEYAGRDSLVKAIADFICQPSVPPADGSLDAFATVVCGRSGQDSQLSFLLDVAMPLARIKFCCIILNDFKTPDGNRRSFSLGASETSRLAHQLSKAKAYLGAFFKF